MSTVSAETATVAGAPRVGADLRAARERLGWPVETMAAGLRIRVAFLTALEAGRVADLPGNAYAIGFLRSYANALGLDPDEVTRRFRAEADDVNRMTELSFPAPVPSRGVPAGAVVLLGVVLAIGAYVGWYRLSGNGELPPEVVPPVPTRLAPLAERAVPPAPVPPGVANPGASAPGGGAAVTSGTVGPAPLTATAAGAGPTAALSAAATPSPASASGASASAMSGSPTSGLPSSASLAAATPGSGAGLTGTAGRPEPTPMASVSPTQAAAATTMPPAAAATQPRIVLSASADAWLQVRDKTGQVLLNRVLHAGEFWAVPAQANLVLTTGNAGGTDILVDGTAIVPLGASGAVRHDIPLDPDLLKAGKLSAAALPLTTASSAAPAAAAVAPRYGAQ